MHVKTTQDRLSTHSESGRRVFSVSEITRAVKSKLEEHFGKVWVEGELSDAKLHTSGHLYFRLKDESAVLDGVMFRSGHSTLRFRPEEGMNVLVSGRISVYEKQGRYQLYAEQMEPRGLGALQLAFEQLKARLEKEGLFDASRKKPLPRIPKRIGIITSPTGAVIRDMLHILDRRFSNVHVLIHPVLVQGPDAPADIARAIETMNQRADTDVLIVARGGGSPEDLWAFNEEKVARAIANSRIPVISAVGHEVDFTIADFVADLRAPTPSAAAELVLPERAKLEADIQSLRQRLKMAVSGLCGLFRERLNQITSRYVFKQPRFYVEQLSQRLDDLLRHLINFSENALDEARRNFKENIIHLEALNPLAILERGYSVTFSPAGTSLADARSVKSGDSIRTRLFRGEIESKVVRIEDRAPVTAKKDHTGE